MFHKWMSEGGELVSCLVCGGMWEDGEGAAAANGESPSRCSGDTSTCHGAAEEHGHESAECSRHECNCVFCA